MMTIVNLAYKPLKPSACGACSGSSSDNNIRVQREIDSEAVIPAPADSTSRPLIIEANVA
ncbi:MULTISPECIES: hypothetical protein [unclassified Nocardiopsis]|uniref:hypothetical protein n=1 Tax=unclassified Nocardiopsis TaxID=2649073 RepID=UPI00135984BF|nr:MULTISPECIES: hypothetical protein [unclassified Nocardiopsis]